MAQKRPNFVFILTDDQGWEDLGCFGHSACFGRYKIQTPVLDKLASEGVRVTNFYVNSPVCSPSRVGFMTGQYPARHGIDFAIHGQAAEDQAIGQKNLLEPTAPNLASVLSDAGYETAHFGKWHMSGAWNAKNNPDAPDAGDYGFDNWACNAMRGEPLWRTDQGEVQAQHTSSEAIVNRSLEFLEGRNATKPFLLNVWFMDPHGVLDPSPEQMEEFRELTPFRGDSDKDSGAMCVYYSAIANLDRQIGRLLDGLDDLGLADNTVIVFTSDNGPAPVWDTGTSNSGAGRTGPFRGIKASLYEGGVRMPFIARWPGRTPKDVVDNDTIMSATDLLPTFCSMAGIEPPPGLDGQDMSEAFLGNSVQRDGALFWEFRFGSWGRHIQFSLRYAMRKGNWKLMMNASGSKSELFDLSRDPSETADCSRYEPEIVADLAAELIAWARSLPSWGKSDQEGFRTYPWPQAGGCAESAEDDLGSAEG